MELAILTAAHNRADRAEAEARAAQSRATAAEALAAIAQARADAAEATVQELRQAIRARDAAEHARRPGSLLKKLKRLYEESRRHRRDSRREDRHP